MFGQFGAGDEWEASGLRKRTPFVHYVATHLPVLYKYIYIYIVFFSFFFSQVFCSLFFSQDLKKVIRLWWRSAFTVGSMVQWIFERSALKSEVVGLSRETCRV